MNKKITSIIAMGCFGISIAATANYDLLGRRGSKMNSPMVYKDIDYSKMKKKNDQKVGSSLTSKALAKATNPGLRGNADAITGIFNNRGLERQNTTYPYYLKRYFLQGAPLENWFSGLTGSNGYMEKSNEVFIPVPMQRTEPTGFLYGTRTNLPTSAYQLTTSNYTFSDPQQPSPYAYSNYGNTQMITYMPFSGVESNAQRYSLWWFDYPSSPHYEWDDVGIYMSIDALPTKLDPSKSVPYFKLASGEVFNPTPASEMMSSRTYDILKASTKHSAIFVGKENPVWPIDHPLNPDHRSPLIYMGVRNRQYGNVDNMVAKQYSFESMAIDNLILTTRRIEVIAAGNFSVRNNSGHLGLEAHAANAITVGAVDAITGKITTYNSTYSLYCKKGIGNCKDGNNVWEGSKKPEIYNYSHFYFDNLSNNNYPSEQKRVYKDKSTGIDYTYNPYYDGSEAAAAYTAGMIANLLAANPFYRWHPEVVKALLLSSGDININTPYPNENPVTTKIPSYRSVVFDKDHNEVFHESRYWLGEISKLYTHSTSNGKKEIRFCVKRPTDKTNFSAAIAWLSSGFDIDDVHRVPQDFDLFVYENSTSNVNNIDVNHPLTSSEDGMNAYEKISFTSNANYLVFRILLWTDRTPSDSERFDQMALGFDVAGI